MLKMAPKISLIIKIVAEFAHKVAFSITIQSLNFIEISTKVGLNYTPLCNLILQLSVFLGARLSVRSERIFLCLKKLIRQLKPKALTSPSRIAPRLMARGVAPRISACAITVGPEGPKVRYRTLWVTAERVKAGGCRS